MNPHDTRGGPGPMRGGDAQAQQAGNSGMGRHGAYGHGPAMAPPPWPQPMWYGPHPYPYPYAPAAAGGFAPPGWGPGPAGWAQPAAPHASTSSMPALGLLNNRFVMGMVVGGALTYVLTNEAIQRAAIRGIMQVWLNVQGGIEETKERFRDAESEIKTGRHG